MVNISNNRSGVVSGYGTDTPEYNEANKSVTKRQIRKQLKSSGSVNISNGKVSSGTTLTTTRSGSVKRDTHKANLKIKKENLATKKAEKIANYKKARLAKQESNAARKAKIQAEKAAKIEARKNSKKS